MVSLRTLSLFGDLISFDLYFFFSAELTSVKSFLKTALHLNRGGSKGDESVPHAVLPSILQALSIQGELHKKIKLFGKNKLWCYSPFVPLDRFVHILVC